MYSNHPASSNIHCTVTAERIHQVIAWKAPSDYISHFQTESLSLVWYNSLKRHLYIYFGVTTMISKMNVLHSQQYNRKELANPLRVWEAVFVLCLITSFHRFILFWWNNSSNSCFSSAGFELSSIFGCIFLLGFFCSQNKKCKVNFVLSVFTAGSWSWSISFSWAAGSAYYLFL